MPRFAATSKPQDLQKRPSAISPHDGHPESAPHNRQNLFACGLPQDQHAPSELLDEAMDFFGFSYCAVPQTGQNFAPTGTAAPQCSQKWPGTLVGVAFGGGGSKGIRVLEISFSIIRANPKSPARTIPANASIKPDSRAIWHLASENPPSFISPESPCTGRITLPQDPLPAEKFEKSTEKVLNTNSAMRITTYSRQFLSPTSNPFLNAATSAGESA
jgi:hypothetical protein